MRVFFISGHTILSGYKTGVQNHDINIIRSLVNSGYDVRVLDYRTKSQYEEDPYSVNEKWLMDRIVFSRLNSRYSKRLPLWVSFGKNAPTHTDEIIIDSYVNPFINRRKVKAILHDLMPVIFPQNYADTTPYITYLKAILKCKEIWANSKSTKADYSRFYPSYEADKIKVVPCCIESDFEEKMLAKASASERVWNEAPFFFYIGDMRKNKNLSVVLEAFEKYARQDRRFNLIIAGKKGKEYENLQRFVDQSEAIRERVIFTGYVSENEKAYLYTHAKGLIFASDYEGFGIPIVEAMACHIPVITSNVSSMPEVAGEAAVLVDPKNVEMIQKAFDTIADENTSSIFVQRGVEQAKLYNTEAQQKIIKKLMD